MPKTLTYDLETCGLDFTKHQPHQIAAILEIDGVEVERIDLRMRPDSGSPVAPVALEVGGLTIEDLRSETRCTQREGYQRLTETLGKYVDKFNKTDKINLIGYNNRGFDDNFLRKLWERNGDNYFGSWFWADTIDVMVLASQDLIDVRHMLPNFKLGTVATRYKIEMDAAKLHDALYDVELTRAIYKRITEGK